MAGKTKKTNTPAAPETDRNPARVKLIELGEKLLEQVEAHRRPKLSVPIRALSNVTFSKAKGYFAIGTRKAHRTLSYQTVRSFAQTVRLMAFAKHLIDTDDFASKREVYYTSKGSKGKSVAGIGARQGGGPRASRTRTSRTPSWTTSRPWPR